MTNKTNTETMEFNFLNKEYKALLETKELYKTIMTGQELQEMLEEVDTEITDLWEEEKLFGLNLESEEELDFLDIEDLD